MGMLEAFLSWFGKGKTLTSDESLQLIGLVEALKSKSKNYEIIAKNHVKLSAKPGETATVYFKINNAS